MAVNDIRSNLLEIVALVPTSITGNGNSVGFTIDTANFELGLMFATHVSTYVNGTYTLLLEESDAANMAGAVAITGDKLIGALPVETAAIASGGTLPTVGVISNLRYVRATIVTTSHASGTTIVGVTCTQKAENMPVA